jgi:hypothetical protein
MLYGHERSRNPSRIIIKIDNSTLESLLSDTELSLPLEVMIGALPQPYAVPGPYDKVEKALQAPLAGPHIIGSKDTRCDMGLVVV